MATQTEDKRLLPLFGEAFWCERISLPKWRWCPECARDVPVFVLREGEMGSLDIESEIVCCWECGDGLEKRR